LLKADYKVALLKFSSKTIFGSFNFSFLILTHLDSTFDLILKSIIFLVTDEDVVALTAGEVLDRFRCTKVEAVPILVTAEDVLALRGEDVLIGFRCAVEDVLTLELT